VVETDELRRRLLSLGIFKNVDALVDKSKRTKPNTYDILIHVEEKSPIGGGFHTAVGNNDGSIVRHFKEELSIFASELQSISFGKIKTKFNSIFSFI